MYQKTTIDGLPNIVDEIIEVINHYEASAKDTNTVLDDDTCDDYVRVWLKCQLDNAKFLLARRRDEPYKSKH